jgi:hypothetical protein
MKILLQCAHNCDLEKGLVTGVLRIAKESIFSDLNNLDVFSLRISRSFWFYSNRNEHLIKDFSVKEAKL